MATDLSTSPGSVAPPGSAPPARRMVGDVGEEIARARAALAGAQSVLRRDDLTPPSAPLAPAHVLDAIAATEAALRRDLRSESTPADRRAHLATALVHLGQARVALREAEAEARTATNHRLSACLDTLRPAATIPELIDAVPRALVDLGYHRGMVSQILHGKWISLSSSVHDDPDQAAAMTDIASRVARPVDSRLIEYDMIDRKRPVLVSDAPHCGRVHPELLELTDTRAYVGAPIVVDTGVAGFVHADCSYLGRAPSPCDAAVSVAVAEVIAFALERVVLNRRLQRITDLVREPDEELMMRLELVRESALGFAAPAHASAAATSTAGENRRQRLDRLSSREMEVLRHLAEGASNTAIAIHMGIAESTVKTHVKHVLRKLDVANRAGAIALYLRLPRRRPA